ncbi:MAG: hypothetical protein WA900_14525, partial [Casimicrobiaceae bacterium]
MCPLTAATSLARGGTQVHAVRLMICGSDPGGGSALARRLVEWSRLAAPAHRFVIDDLSGHDHDTPQYARDFIAAGSIADVALVLVDAGRGLDAQARRHSHLASLLGTP